MGSVASLDKRLPAGPLSSLYSFIFTSPLMSRPVWPLQVAGLLNSSSSSSPAMPRLEDGLCGKRQSDVDGEEADKNAAAAQEASTLQRQEWPAEVVVDDGEEAHAEGDERDQVEVSEEVRVEGAGHDARVRQLQRRHRQHVHHEGLERLWPKTTKDAGEGVCVG